MPETKSQVLSGVAETSLIALYIRALESQRPGGLIKDEKAVALVAQRSDEFVRIQRFPMSDMNIATTIRRNQKFDHTVLDFLTRHPEAVVVHIGCGLDTRFERVDNGRVEWYDLDLPEVIELRRMIWGDEGGRYHLLGCSALEETWLEAVSVHRQNYRRRQRPILFLAEGVFMYFEAAQVKWLVRTLCDRFPGAELVFDAFNPFHVWTNTRLFSRIKLGAPLYWGIWHGQELEDWHSSVRLLEDWGWLDEPEPRLSFIRWLRPLPIVGRMMRIYHFQLGEAAG